MFIIRLRRTRRVVESHQRRKTKAVQRVAFDVSFIPCPGQRAIIVAKIDSGALKEAAAKRKAEGQKKGRDVRYGLVAPEIGSNQQSGYVERQLADMAGVGNGAGTLTYAPISSRNAARIRSSKLSQVSSTARVHSSVPSAKET